jgi:lysophospholipase L1-like esterase
MILKNKSVKIYFVFLHLLLFILVIKYDIYSHLSDKIREEKDLTTTKFYQTMLAFQDRADQNSPEGAVVFLGDSHIQGLCVSAVSQRTINLGIGGDTTEAMLQRISKYRSVEKARAIVLEIGINDILHNRAGENIVQNFETLISQLPEQTAKIVYQVFPVDERLRAGINHRINLFNENLINICTTEKNCHLNSINNELSDSTGNLDKQYHLGDGLHLNRHGYQVWINSLKLELSKITEMKQKHPQKNSKENKL